MWQLEFDPQNPHVWQEIMDSFKLSPSLRKHTVATPTFPRNVRKKIFFKNLGYVALILLLPLRISPLGTLGNRGLRSTGEDLKVDLVSAGQGRGLQPT